MANTLNLMLKLLVKVLTLVLFCVSSNLAAANSALIIRGQADMFDEIVKGMVDDLEQEFKTHSLTIDNKTRVNDIDKMMKKTSPDIIILMGNKSVNLYADFQDANKQSSYPPAIAVAALFIDQVNTRLKNVSAIRYEIPAVTSAVSIRSILKKPVKKIGVVYREWMKDMIEENRAYCEKEGLELVGVQLPNKMRNVSKKVKRALKELNEEVDVIWILNDNGLLTKDALIKAWLPNRVNSRLPAIVGIKQFITKIPLGAFAVVPDNYGLGAQVADMVFEIMDNEWQLEQVKVHQPVSVKKFLNSQTLSNKGIRIKSETLNQLDEVIEQK